MSDKAAPRLNATDELAIMRARPNVFPDHTVALVRAAWAEGFDAGERDAMDPNVDTHTCVQNPYGNGRAAT